MNEGTHLYIPVSASGGFGPRIDAVPDPVTIPDASGEEEEGESSGEISLESFTVYQEESGGSYVCHNPLVVASDGEVPVAGATGLSSGNTWYCVVRRDAGGDWSAKMTTNPEDGREVNDRVFLSVRIATIASASDGGSVDQWHTGAIVAAGGEVNLIGNTEDSEETGGSPVKFLSGTDSNVVIRTVGDELKIDVYYV